MTHMLHPARIHCNVLYLNMQYYSNLSVKDVIQGTKDLLITSYNKSIIMIQKNRFSQHYYTGKYNPSFLLVPDLHSVKVHSIFPLFLLSFLSQISLTSVSKHCQNSARALKSYLPVAVPRSSLKRNGGPKRHNFGTF